MMSCHLEVARLSIEFCSCRNTMFICYLIVGVQLALIHFIFYFARARANFIVISLLGNCGFILHIFSSDDEVLYLQVVINQWSLMMRQDARLQNVQSFALIIVASLEGLLP